VKQKINCPCDNIFDAEIPETIDLDAQPELSGEIIDGAFLSFTCTRCGKTHKPEFPLTLLWPSKKLTLEVLPETERGAFYRRKKDSPGVETIISYPEMAERIAVIQDGLEPIVIEALKYYILAKAQKDYPENDISMWYRKKDPEALEFHLLGIREGETAISRIPFSLYEKNAENYRRNPRGELFSSLKIRSYVSVQNLMRPEELL
jgi:hypothetical protein